MLNDSLLGVIFWTAYILYFGFWGGYVAARCRRSAIEGVMHGWLGGPFGLLLLALYPQPKSVDKPVTVVPDNREAELLTQILAELQWQHQQKEKEIIRAKAAQSNKS